MVESYADNKKCKNVNSKKYPIKIPQKYFSFLLRYTNRRNDNTAKTTKHNIVIGKILTESTDSVVSAKPINDITEKSLFFRIFDINSVRIVNKDIIIIIIVKLNTSRNNNETNVEIYSDPIPIPNTTELTEDLFFFAKNTPVPVSSVDTIYITMVLPKLPKSLKTNTPKVINPMKISIAASIDKMFFPTKDSNLLLFIVFGFTFSLYIVGLINLFPQEAQYIELFLFCFPHFEQNIMNTSFLIFN